MTCIINDDPFAGCTGIKAITLPDSITSLGSRAFDSDVKLGPPTHPLLLNMIDETDESIGYGDGITADELESAADELQKSMASVVSGGLSKSHPLVAEATKVHKSLRDRVAKTTVSAVDIVSIF